MEDDKTPKVRGMLINDMPESERPREKAARGGIKTLTDAELMAIIFSTGVHGKSVIQLSQEILSDFNGHLSKVARLSVAELCRHYKGIGEAKAISLLAALELGARAGADAQTVSDPVIRSSGDAYAVMRPELERLAQEEFWILCLSQSGRVQRKVNISRGGVAATYVDVKVILKHAIDNLSTSLILFHNHPSGNLSPSAADDELTRRITEAARIMGIVVNDHIIVGDNGYYSYRDEGRL